MGGAEDAQEGAFAVPGEVTEITTGLDNPWALAFLPDGSALVTERTTHLIKRVLVTGGPAEVVGEVPGVGTSAEGGLLGLAVSPGFEADQLVYVYVSASPSNRVAAFRVAEDFGSLEEAAVILDGIGAANRHHWGRLRFGPDGMLWIGTGDAFDPARALDPGFLNGKVLRVRPDGAIPEDNPWGTAVYSLGHRNVQGLAFGPDGAVYAAELGWNEWDELNVLAPGGDYGWPEAEGRTGDRGVEPIFVAAPEKASPSGIAYAEGSIWMAALRGQALWQIPVAAGETAGEPQAHFVGEFGRLRAVEVAPDGALWVTTSNTDRTTLGGAPVRNGDDRILRIELMPGGES